MNKNKLKTGFELYKEEVKGHKWTFAVYVILRSLVVAIGVVSFFRGNYENVFYCILSLILFLLPAFVTKNFGIELPQTLEIIVLAFVFAAEILGELAGFYQKVTLWDSMLHTTTGFLAAAIGFALLDIFNKNEHFKFQISPVYMAIAAFCFSMTVGAVWELFEFSMDFFFGLYMQKDMVITSLSSVSLDLTKSNEVITLSDIAATELVTKSGEVICLSDYGIHGYLDIGIIDTMKDLFVNLIGALVFSVIGYFYIKTRGKGKLVRKFIPTIKEAKEDR
jgi:hypothetical protein